MKVQKFKNGVIKMTATSKRDSLNLLKFVSAAAGNHDPEREALISQKEKELNESKSNVNEAI